MHFLSSFLYSIRKRNSAASPFFLIHLFICFTFHRLLSIDPRIPSDPLLLKREEKTSGSFFFSFPFFLFLFVSPGFPFTFSTNIAGFWKVKKRKKEERADRMIFPIGHISFPRSWRRFHQKEKENKRDWKGDKKGWKKNDSKWKT